MDVNYLNTQSNVTSESSQIDNFDFVSTYQSKTVDQYGDVAYTAEENQSWRKLILKQEPLVQKWGCDEYLDGLKEIKFPKDRVPQCHEISKVLNEKTGWILEPVPSLIPNQRFFELLANRKFPAATFVRRDEDFGYCAEPDIFHEMFGHCPLLTKPEYADFAHLYGKLCLNATPAEQAMLARLYWFTLEVGLIKTKQGVRAYGGSILSSVNEIDYCMSEKPVLKPFDLKEVVTTPYRIDILQPIYFVIDSFDALLNLLNIDLLAEIRQIKASH